MEKLSVAFPPLSLHKINPTKKQAGVMQAMGTARYEPSISRL